MLLEQISRDARLTKQTQEQRLALFEEVIGGLIHVQGKKNIQTFIYSLHSAL